MKRRDIDRKLKAAGWEITSGNRHDMAKHPDKPGIKIPLPRHADVNEYTAQGILEQAGLKQLRQGRKGDCIMKYVYPAIFTPLSSGEYDVRVPDLPGCITCGNDLADAIEMAQDAVAMWLCDAEDNNEDIPHPSEKIDIDPPKFVSLVIADTLEYRRENDNKAVKKTLTIPSWLNVQGERAGVNFSQVLQDALKHNLGLENPRSARRQP